MLTNDQNVVLHLLRKSFNIPTQGIQIINKKKVEEYILKNGIFLTVYQSLPSEMQMSFGSDYFTTISQSIRQDYEGNKILTELSNDGMDCIALKGWELRKLYPEPTMRQMSDLDILVKPYDYSRIKAVMERLDYICEEESSWMHDNFTNGDVLVEMHKRLTDDSEKIQCWEQGIWSRANKLDEHIFCMSPEDYYIFHFVHLHKDFLNGSLGLRRMVDTWLLQKQSLDMETVFKKIDEFGIRKFHDRMVILSNVVMGTTEMDESSEFLLTHAFKYGIFGSDISYKAGRIANMGGNLKSGKLISAMAAVFLPYKRMKAHFPILTKHPILLPYCWCKRIARFLRGDLTKSRNMLDYSEISNAEYNEMKQFLKAGGC